MDSSQDLAIAYVHFFVDDLPRWQRYFQQIFSLELVDHQNFFNHLPSRSVYLRSPELQFVLSAPSSPDDRVARYLNEHPCGVADIAFFVKPAILAQLNLSLKQASVIENPVGFRHTLIPKERISHTNVSIDHLVLNVAQGDLDKTLHWYVEKLGFFPQQSFHIKTDYSGLESQVLRHPSGIQLPINQPGDRRSQIQEFVEHNRGAGIQHIAIKQRNLPAKISRLRELKMNFLDVPFTYYQNLLRRYPFLISLIDWPAIQDLAILVDVVRSPDEMLMQIFTQPIFQEPTFFWEFIERRQGATGFGAGNFQALFEAIETAQKKRALLL